jgi:hypothetical protein
LLNYKDQEFALQNPFGIWMQSALEEAKESQADSKERTMMITGLTEEPGLIAASMDVFGDTDCNKQRAPKTSRRIMRLHA